MDQPISVHHLDYKQVPFIASIDPTNQRQITSINPSTGAVSRINRSTNHRPSISSNNRCRFSQQSDQPISVHRIPSPRRSAPVSAHAGAPRYRVQRIAVGLPGKLGCPVTKVVCSMSLEHVRLLDALQNLLCARVFHVFQAIGVVGGASCLAVLSCPHRRSKQLKTVCVCVTQVINFVGMRLDRCRCFKQLRSRSRLPTRRTIFNLLFGLECIPTLGYCTPCCHLIAPLTLEPDAHVTSLKQKKY